MARRPGREEWKQLVAEYEDGELSQKEFAAKHDVALATLQFHLYKIRKSRNSESAGSFVPVEVVACSAPKARPGEVIEAATRSGIVMRFVVGTDTRYLAELFAAIG
jgi:hypothetical protein